MAKPEITFFSPTGAQTFDFTLGPFEGSGTWILWNDDAVVGSITSLVRGPDHSPVDVTDHGLAGGIQHAIQHVLSDYWG